ncbi:putative NIT2-nitrilase [Cantharellus anzutake]|uniref:putative NIT2-nitrilase n=1 Tax=Cantharellus anzutake TaxID=1750568 RepID=UPI0019058974|nr:putative NIT2-nitrilase [Cantharellus anzutake]KAF8337037.1 putative NIT2-nitrilase [Cantharellus anzutake]
MCKATAAVVQITSTPSVARNVQTVTRLLTQAASRGAGMVFLPEAADFMSPASSVFELSQPLERHSFLNAIRESARSLGLFVNVGIHERPPSSVSMEKGYNTNVVIAKDGSIISKYRKVHLFDVDLSPTGPKILESATTIPGTEIVAPVSTPIGKLGLQTCYDIRFAEPSNSLTRQGAELLAYPSAFAPHTGAAHWETLLKARAIENQCYVLGSAQSGEHFPSRSSYGRAMIVDPWGTIVAQCPQIATEKGKICFAEIDLGYLNKVRREMPMGWALK